MDHGDKKLKKCPPAGTDTKIEFPSGGPRTHEVCLQLLVDYFLLASSAKSQFRVPQTEVGRRSFITSFPDIVLEDHQLYTTLTHGVHSSSSTLKNQCMNCENLRGQIFYTNPNCNIRHDFFFRTVRRLPSDHKRWHIRFLNFRCRQMAEHI